MCVEDTSSSCLSCPHFKDGNAEACRLTQLTGAELIHPSGHPDTDAETSCLALGWYQLGRKRRETQDRSWRPGAECRQGSSHCGR